MCVKYIKNQCSIKEYILSIYFSLKRTEYSAFTAHAILLFLGTARMVKSFDWLRIYTSNAFLPQPRSELRHHKSNFFYKLLCKFKVIFFPGVKVQQCLFKKQYSLQDELKFLQCGWKFQKCAFAKKILENETFFLFRIASFCICEIQVYFRNHMNNIQNILPVIIYIAEINISLYTQNALMLMLHRDANLKLIKKLRSDSEIMRHY